MAMSVISLKTSNYHILRHAPQIQNFPFKKQSVSLIQTFKSAGVILDMLSIALTKVMECHNLCDENIQIVPIHFRT